MLFKIVVGLVIIAALVFGGMFYYNYQDQTAVADDISAKIQSDKNTLNIISKSTDEINADIAEINADADSVERAIAEARVILPDRFNPNDLVKSVISQGQASGVTVIPINNGDWQKVKIGTSEYQILRMSLQVEGTQPKMLAFLRGLILIYDTLVFENIKVNYETPTPTPTPTTTIKWTETEVNLAVYAK